ncbi:HAD domain-containing protein [Actinocatenispora rupis]|uniref:Secreted protein n=1 Tax=Actinocatenispora rupis TaxID=519421 RepID=A0A8J3J651_9ACTN|nr:hypothetical protein Aru02nite_16680 [Actinocatenispora rupis]
MTRPLLFLDVDGPLIPFGGTTRHPTYGPAGANPLLARIDPAHGPRLAALGCTLVWATSWLDDANDEVAPRLGLPPLPVVHWPSDDPGTGGRHWKTDMLVDWAAGRAFAWIDDEIGAADRRRVAAHHPGPALLHRIDPTRGLTPDDYATIHAWLRTLP